MHKLTSHSNQSVPEEGSKVGGHWTLPLDLTPKLDPLQIQNPFIFVLHFTSSSFPFHPFRTLHFSHFPPPTVHFLSGPRIVMGSKVDGHWTLPYKMTLGRPRPNSKPFQIPTEDNSLFLSLSPFSHFSFFKNSQSFHTTHSVLEEGSKVCGHWSLL